MVPTKLDRISINIEATTLIASDRVTRILHVHVSFMLNNFGNQLDIDIICVLKNIIL